MKSIDKKRVLHLVVSPLRGTEKTPQRPAKGTKMAQGEGVGGEVNLSPKGKKEVEPNRLSNPLSPRGLVGFDLYKDLGFLRLLSLRQRGSIPSHTAKVAQGRGERLHTT